MTNHQPPHPKAFHKRRLRRNRAGYVLIMTLLLIAVSVIMLAGFARHGLLLAIDASQAQDDLQRRWGMVSCRRALLERADKILEKRSELRKREDAARPLPCRVTTQLKLGHMEFSIILADEDAKLNLNSLYRRNEDRRMVPEAIRRLSPANRSLPIDLRPHRNDAEKEVPPFTSWGQVFSLSNADTATPIAEQLMQSTQQITCWGGGRLNVRRAPEATLREVFRLMGAGQSSDELLAQRGQDASGLIAGIRSATQDASLVDGLLTDTSGVYSLWIRVTSDRHSSYALFVGSPSEQMPGSAFVW